MRSGSEATAAYRHAAQGERDVDIDEPVRLSGILGGSEELARQGPVVHWCVGTDRRV